MKKKLSPAIEPKTKTISCPRQCGAELPLEQHPTNEQRLVAYCSCSGSRQAVYETDKES